LPIIGTMFFLTTFSAMAVGDCSSASRSGSHWLVATAGPGPASWVDHPAHLVLHKGHRRSEPLRRGPAGPARDD
jgi:hypothetical protein